MQKVYPAFCIFFFTVYLFKYKFDLKGIISYERKLHNTNACLFNGYKDDNFKPDKSMIRSECAIIINNLLKRVSDTITISISYQVRFLSYMPKTHWAYNQIMEATVPHTYNGKI